jgi:small-conductance mechanosensitive channel
MPMEKPEGATVVDMGGPTPQDSKPTDDSNKIDATKGAKSATAPTTKPSAASSDTQNNPQGGKKTMREEEQVEEKVFAEDIDALFADDSTISEEFKTKVSTIFEARVQDRISQLEEEVEAKYSGMLEEAVEAIKDDLTEKVNDYLGYVVEQWMADNEIAIEKGIRSELAEEFISGLKNLFAEHYIDVPEDKVDLVEELAARVEETESKLNEEIERGIELRKQLVESRKEEITHTVTEGLTDTQVEKIKSLAESVEFSTEEEYKTKLETIRENYFPSGVKKADVEQLHEQVEDASNQATKAVDPFVASVVNSISKTLK